MHNQLHAAAFIKEALGDDGISRGDSAQHGASGHNVFNGLLRAGIVQSALAFEPLHGIQNFRRLLVDEAGNGVGSEIADLLPHSAICRESSSVRPGASPSQNGIEGGAPCASSTRMRPADSTRRMRQLMFPSRTISPFKLSTAKSSCSVPTTVPSGSATTV